MNIDWLKEICTTSDVRSITQQPYSIMINGEQWAFSTNGWVIYAIKIDNDFPNPHGFDSTVARIADWFKIEKSNRVTSVKCVRDWAGPDTFEYCRECNDLSLWGAFCGNCNGSGYINYGYEERTGLIDGVLINRWLIAKAFHHLPDGPAYVVTTGREDLVHFVGDGWHVSVMPMRYRNGTTEPVVFVDWDEEVAKCN